ncbi:adenylate kinase family protein [Bradyrhizobium vignae]|uniref:adenylate kinase family protein n=1 Tax=Bradyrhizobium vignae TaxID=1549949 RepID=UPI003D31A895
MPQLSTGDMLRRSGIWESRDRATRGGDHGARRARPGRSGDRVIAERFAKPDSDRGFILDGFPRTVAQAESLDHLLKGHELSHVLELKLLDRILG